MYYDTGVYFIGLHAYNIKSLGNASSKALKFVTENYTVRLVLSFISAEPFAYVVASYRCQYGDKKSDYDSKWVGEGPECQLRAFSMCALRYTFLTTTVFDPVSLKT